MPGGPGKVQTAVLRNPGTGAALLAPPRSTRYIPLSSPGSGDFLSIEGPFWRHLVNYHAQDGVLEPRPRLTASGFTLTGSESVTEPPLAYSERANDIVNHVLHVIQIPDYNTGSARSAITVVITGADIAVENGAGWHIATPTYTAGTITVSGGGTAVTGAGTAWTDRQIRPGMHIEINNLWYYITQVNSNTSLDITPAIGAGVSGVAYTIRRCMGGGEVATNTINSDHNDVSAVLHNGDLYIAGPMAGGFNIPAVIKVTNLAGTPTATYLTADVDITGSLDVLANITYINDIDVLQTGHVMLAVEEGTASARLRWCDPTDDTVWIASPAGFTDVVAGGSGPVTALGRLGRLVTVHFDDTIALGNLTGQSTPPLTFEPTRAQVGCGLRRTLKVYRGREFFMNDGVLYSFNGSTTEPVSEAARTYISGQEKPAGISFTTGTAVTALKTKLQRWRCHGWIDRQKQKYLFFWPVKTSNDTNDSARNSLAVEIDLAGGDAFLFTFPNEFAFAEHFHARPGISPDLSDAAFDHGRTIVGLTHVNDANQTPVFDSILGAWFERHDGDAVVPYVDPGSDDILVEHQAESMPLDFGYPGLKKSIEKVLVFFRKPIDYVDNISPHNYAIELSDDNGATFPAALSQDISLAISGLSSNEEEIKIAFPDEDRSAENWVLRIRSRDDAVGGDRDIAVAQIVQILIRFMVHGDVETT